MTEHNTTARTAHHPRTWLITGASSGIGRALTVAALDAGDFVIGTARRPERFNDLVDRYGDRFTALAHDVRNTDRAPEIIRQALDLTGRIDVLVNNAGGGQVGTAEEIGDADLRDMLDQHLFGPAALVRAVLPHMRAAHSGTIVQMSSQGGRLSFPAVGSYSAGKFALEGWSEALAGEVRPFGIRVLIVEPSRFRTGFNAPGVLKTASVNPNYEEVTGAIRADMADADGLQEGDPARAALAIRRVLDMEDAPLRLPLGAEAVGNLTRAYRAALTDVERLAELSASADFPGTTAPVRAFQRSVDDAATAVD
ncbi:SDR family NAD(P)-dependent oxidoreductase [Corynebacterium variabile]|uniref:SDR family NAD(P)-dependent oxidoreductase n=1 Tax=Corynebacterium variabile TaxID=1727 RepID=UPI003A946307